MCGIGLLLSSGGDAGSAGHAPATKPAASSDIPADGAASAVPATLDAIRDDLVTSLARRGPDHSGSAVLTVNVMNHAVFCCSCRSDV